MITCLELSVDSDVDLVFSEYLLNDGFDAQNRVRVVREGDRRSVSSRRGFESL